MTGFDFAALYQEHPAASLTEVNGLSLPEALKWYHRNGYHVRPTWARGGLAGVPAGYSFDTLARPSAEEIAWLAENWNPRWQLAMIMSAGSGLWAIDADDQEQGERFCKEIEPDPTAYQVTGSGKWHMVYRRQDGDDLATCPGAWSGEYPRIEVHAKHLITVAPSLHHQTGQPYQWSDGREPQEAGRRMLAARRQSVRELLVGMEADKARIRREAVRQLDAEEYALTWRQPTAEEFPGTLADSLARPRPEQRYLIGGLWGAAHNLSIEALYKVGKSTLVASAAGSLADGTPFLGFAEAHPPEGPVAIWNTEMDPDDVDDYLAPHVRDHSRVVLGHLRGRPVQLMLSAADRKMTVAWLRYHGTEVWIIDSWSRLCAWSGIDPIDNGQVARLAACVDEIKGEAGVKALAVTSHMPQAARQDRTQERGLGAQTFSGWVDCMWRYVRKEDGRRFLSADGRKVTLPECNVVMDGHGRLIAQQGDRDQADGMILSYSVLTWLRLHPGASTSAVCKGIAGRKETVTAALKELESKRLAWSQPGAKGSIIWTVAG